MKLTIKLFAALPELLGGAELAVTIEQDSITVEQLKAYLQQQYPPAAATIGQSFFAVNQAYAAPHDLIHERDELALIPPVSGGGGLA